MDRESDKAMVERVRDKRVWRKGSRVLNWPVGSRLVQVRRGKSGLVLTFDDGVKVQLRGMWSLLFSEEVLDF